MAGEDEPIAPRNSRIREAVEEIETVVRERFPSTSFRVSEENGEEAGTFIWATVDVEDTDQVMEAALEKLRRIQDIERLPVYLVPVHTPERVLAAMRLRRPGMAEQMERLTAQP